MPTYRVFDTSAIPTTEDLLNEFLVNMVSTAEGVTDIAVGSKMWTVGYTLSRQLASIYYTLHFYRKQSFVITATGKYLDLHGIEVGILRHLATRASGEVLFFRDSPSPIDIIIPTGTIVTTPLVSSNTQPIKYATVQDVVMVSGTTEVAAYVQCLTSGPDGNVPAGTITRLESILPGTQRVSGGVMSGGQEIEDDDSYRERILTAWAARETGTTAAIRNAVLNVAGIRNVMIIDPARARIGQLFNTLSLVSGQEQLRIETISPLEAKYDLRVALVNNATTGLTMTIKQVDERGELISEEIIPNITSGWDLLDKINSWSQSATIHYNQLFLDSDPYDDPVKQATNNEIVHVKSIAPMGNTRIVLVIEDMENPSIVGQKRLTVTTQARYYHNQILGQTETSPLVEVFDEISTYQDMVTRINDSEIGSKFIKMTLLETKTAQQTLNPEPYMTGKNIVRTSFAPLVEIISPIHEDIKILDADAGIVEVGRIASPFALTYSYKAQVVDELGIKTAFADLPLENIVTSLQPDGSELVVASPVLTPDIVSNTGLNFCAELPQSFDERIIQSIYKIIRGRVDVTIVPYSLTATPDPLLLERVIAAIEKVRPAGIEVNIIYPNTRIIDVVVNVEVISGTNYYPSQFYDIIKTNITNYINSLQMGETAYVDKIIAVANPSVKGLKVARVISPTNDVTVSATAFLRAGNIYFREQQNSSSSYTV